MEDRTSTISYTFQTSGRRTHNCPSHWWIIWKSLKHMEAGTKHTLNFQNHTENYGVKSNNLNIFTRPICTKSKINTLNIVERVPIYIDSISDKATLSSTSKSSLKTFTIIKVMLLKSICLFLSSYNIMKLWNIVISMQVIINTITEISTSHP